MAQYNTPERAMRCARAIASDIAAYYEERIIRGIQEDTLFEDLKPEFDEGLALYRSRVTPELLETTNFYYRAIVDVIIKNKGHIQSKIW